MFGELKFFGSQKFPFHQREKITLEAVLKKHVEFKYPNNIKDFNMYLDFFQRKWDTECNDNILMGEDNVFHKLVVMDDVLGLADKSDNFPEIFQTN